MQKERVIRNVNSLNLRKRKTINNSINKRIVLFISSSLFVVLLTTILVAFTQFNLTNIARQNYATVKKIEQLNKDIDTLKNELINATNVINIQKESKELGFVYEGNVNYVK